jgi:hypothetical protein
VVFGAPTAMMELEVLVADLAIRRQNESSLEPRYFPLVHRKREGERKREKRNEGVSS